MDEKTWEIHSQEEAVKFPLIYQCEHVDQNNNIRELQPQYIRTPRRTSKAQLQTNWTLSLATCEVWITWHCLDVTTMLGRPPVMKRGKIGHTDHLWCMDSWLDMCNLLLTTRLPGWTPVHAKRAMHPEGKTCATAVFDARVDGRKTHMQAAVTPRQVLP
jgi:hypothetical protein